MGRAIKSYSKKDTTDSYSNSDVEIIDLNKVKKEEEKEEKKNTRKRKIEIKKKEDIKDRETKKKYFEERLKENTELLKKTKKSI